MDRKRIERGTNVRKILADFARVVLLLTSLASAEPSPAQAKKYTTVIPRPPFPKFAPIIPNNPVNQELLGRLKAISSDIKDITSAMERGAFTMHQLIHTEIMKNYREMPDEMMLDRLFHLARAQEKRLREEDREMFKDFMHKFREELLELTNLLDSSLGQKNLMQFLEMEVGRDSLQNFQGLKAIDDVERLLSEIKKYVPLRTINEQGGFTPLYFKHEKDEKTLEVYDTVRRAAFVYFMFQVKKKLKNLEG
jgi:hypothetical protein